MIDIAALAEFWMIAGIAIFVVLMFAVVRGTELLIARNKLIKNFSEAVKYKDEDKLQKVLRSRNYWLGEKKITSVIINEITDTETLYNIVRHGGKTGETGAALKKITDESVLKQFAVNHRFGFVRRAACEKIYGQHNFNNGVCLICGTNIKLYKSLQRYGIYE